MQKSNFTLLIFGLISIIGYIILGYFSTRDQTVLILTAYLSLFTAYIATWHSSKTTPLKFYIYLAIGLRLLLLFSTPSLSDDIYRFIWDGRLLASGISPFSALPIDILSSSKQITGIDQSLFDLLNSPVYFTVYPPLSQLVFWLAALISSDSITASIIFVRVLIILAEVGSIILITKLLKQYQLPSKNVLIYALNPLVIIELSGNLHFEAFVILFILLTVYLFNKNKHWLSGICWGAAIGFKLIPLIFLPLMLRRLSFKSQIIIYSTTSITIILLFIPLYDQALIDGLSSSLTLYFQKFEFNASVYYLARTVGYWFKGYNIIAQLGPSLGIITFCSIVVYSLLSKQKKTLLPTAMMWALLIYLLLATTVHPWYITTIVALSVFSNYRFATLWSLLIFLTYAGYSLTGYQEPLALVIIEYIVLTGFIGYELYNNNNVSTDQSRIYK
jgi:hypothetical protein